MKKSLLILLTSVSLFWACGEVGYESDISKAIAIDPVSVAIDIPAMAIGQVIPQTPPITVTTDAIDFGGNDFDDYDLGDVKFYRINEILFSIDGFDPGSGANLNEADLSIDMNLIINGGTTTLLNTTIRDLQDNVNDVLLFDRMNPGSVNQAAIASLEQLLLDGGTFALELVMVGRDVLLQTTTQNFDIIFKFDVTARVQLIE